MRTSSRAEGFGSVLSLALLLPLHAGLLSCSCFSSALAGCPLCQTYTGPALLWPCLLLWLLWLLGLLLLWLLSMHELATKQLLPALPSPAAIIVQHGWHLCCWCIGTQNVCLVPRDLHRSPQTDGCRKCAELKSCTTSYQGGILHAQTQKLADFR